ncbi:MAG: poly-beta-1,6-N-acetyl-D-glucosamine biosynthesis protein PgaD [Candidatus Omnitrophica bacterium]|nr:poly-beta-1,6-N-acetyl-D-glucosamine biosynthesis protein PgaD [Candidatus Omnitrophota bacterium]
MATRDMKRKDEEARPLIINRPDALGKARKWTEWGVTTFGWIAWMFVCRPIMIAMLWALGIHLFYFQMVKLGGFGGIVELFWVYFWVILFIWLAIRSWNLYNYLRFRRREARRNTSPAEDGELERFMKLPTEALKTIHNSNITAVDFMEGYKIQMRDISGGDSSAAYPGYFNPSKPNYDLMKLRKKSQK